MKGRLTPHCAPVVTPWGMANPRRAVRAPLDLAAVERELRARDGALQERLAALSRPPERGSELGFGKRIGDGTTEAVSRLTDVAVGSSLEASEARIARALAKLADGSYGVCDSCGDAIGVARLNAAPESVLCIGCARLAR
jgi:DnaK suppressor protein